MNTTTDQPWTAEEILALGRSYQGAAVLAAAADLDLFSALAPAPLTAAELARTLQCDLRGLTILLDALVALRLLEKSRQPLCPAGGPGRLSDAGGRAKHSGHGPAPGHCLRNWAQLARVVKTGRPAERMPGVRGEAGDQEAFIGAMHNISAPNADQVIRAVQPLQFRHLLDIGGASGTWTIAFLRACPSAQATLFDLPHVIPMAQRRLAAARLGAARQARRRRLHERTPCRRARTSRG